MLNDEFKTQGRYNNIRYVIQSEEKVPARSRFFDAKFDGFWSFSQKVLQTQKLYISHLKALILSCYEPEEQGA